MTEKPRSQNESFNQMTMRQQYFPIIPGDKSHLECVKITESLGLQPKPIQSESPGKRLDNPYI